MASSNTKDLAAELERLGERLEGETIRLRAGVASDVAAGVRKELAPLDLPDELRVLYGWRNGMGANPVIDFAPFGFEWFSLEGAMELRRSLAAITYAKPPNLEHFLPMGNLDSGLVLASLTGIHTRISQLYGFLPEEGEVCLLHADVLSLIKMATAWLGDKTLLVEELRLEMSPGAWSFDQDGKVGRDGSTNVFDLFSCQVDDLVAAAAQV